MRTQRWMIAEKPNNPKRKIGMDCRVMLVEGVSILPHGQNLYVSSPTTILPSSRKPLRKATNSCPSFAKPKSVRDCNPGNLQPVVIDPAPDARFPQRKVELAIDSSDATISQPALVRL